MRSSQQRNKVTIAVLSGTIVGVIAALIHAAMMPPDRAALVPALVGDFIAALTTIIVCLAIQLRQEEVHYLTAIERAAIVSELNHHVRNAIFPLCLVVQKFGDDVATKMANEAVDKINLALRDATTDALSGRTDYVGTSIATNGGGKS
jgi:uncharacterized MnhB-related membrane protein